MSKKKVKKSVAPKKKAPKKPAPKKSAAKSEVRELLLNFKVNEAEKAAIAATAKANGMKNVSAYLRAIAQGKTLTPQVAVVKAQKKSAKAGKSFLT